MPGCCALGCKNRTEKGFRTFKFPSDLKRKRVWEVNVRRPDWTPTPGSRLCEVHFTPDQFKTDPDAQRRRLRPLAVPTLFAHSKPVKPPRKPPLHRPHPHYELARLREIVAKEHAYYSRDSRPLSLIVPSWDSPKKGEMQILGSVVRMPDGSGSQVSFVAVKREVEDYATVEVLPALPASDSGMLEAAEEEVFTCDPLSHRRELELQQKQVADMKRLAYINGSLKSQLQQAKDSLDKTRKELKRTQRELQKYKKRNADLQSESSFLTEDQRLFLRRRSMKGYQWTRETLQKALKIRLSVGYAGYKTLLNLNYPLPSIKTLQVNAEKIYKEIVDDWDKNEDNNENAEHVDDPLLAESAGAVSIDNDNNGADRDGKTDKKVGEADEKSVVDNGVGEVGKYLASALGGGSSNAKDKAVKQKRTTRSTADHEPKETLESESESDEEDVLDLKRRKTSESESESDGEDDGEFVFDDLLDGHLAKALGVSGERNDSADDL